MTFELPPLPYSRTAFGDLISEATFDYHHGKHHNAYVTKTNAAIEGTDHADRKLSEIIKVADGGLFNNAAQVWNHSFYWLCLSPEKKDIPAELVERLVADFGSVEEFKSRFAAEATGHFASGWAWLVLNDGKLEITSYHDADTPVAHGVAPLLTLDVWEHAYYLDYQNARPAYVSALLENAIDWDFVAQNLDGKGVSRADQG
ncbi:superoxide dismutase, Fe-Mn family [Parasphingorhabdus marina DSM 22363]|uniref:Superoxide dismutase n=1 Tax=Parasphingorhabdus marina DSM 22363 TaxID=1123272 RepID=A0A1N6FIN4_9SPHN|nr:superoxide dismutase [Parasphingorhabdus marina]SIN95148.1 superoxide dismutase, Fe-Mn family [Parasphingorhabdus marina DSM 22363]